MSDTPLVVQRSKRKQPATTPSSRKRVRISDDVGTRKSSSGRLGDQKTLTQIQWVHSPTASFENDSSMRELEIEPEGRSGATGPRTSKVKRRKSTLTQMNWLGSFQVHEDNDMADLDMLPQQAETDHDHVPQMDGIYESPRKKRKQKLSALSSSPPSIDRETQDYQPTQAQVNEPRRKSTTARRRSRRIASKVLSDPDENFVLMEQALSPDKHPSVISRPSKPPKLEIMDSVDMDDDLTPTQPKFQPQTPQRKREIPSSQTPETVTKSRRQRLDLQRKNEMSPSKLSARTPLQEKPVNSPLKGSLKRLRHSKSTLQSSKLSSRRSKVCVLKVPSRALLQRSGRVEDSQRDVYSLPATSSSTGASRHSHSPTRHSRGKPSVQDTAEQVEIPSTSQARNGSHPEVPSSPPNAETQGSLPDLCELIPVQHRQDMQGLRKSEDNAHHQADGEDSIRVHDFGKPASQNHEASAGHSEARLSSNDIDGNEDMLLDAETSGVEEVEHETIATEIIENEDANSAFGSPIPNDTQFNIGLLERTSSPRITGTPTISHIDGSPSGPRRLQTPTDVSLNSGLQHPNDDDQEVDLYTKSPLPTPRLVGGNFRSKHLQSQTGDIGKDSLKLPPLPKPDSYMPTLKIPLNDTTQTSSSSSPLLPPVKPTTQKSVHPASLPRFSQLSTQEPTQNFLLSSLPQPTQHRSDQERITIKDSSSVRLSQVPQYHTQSQGLNLQLVDDSDGDDDDLDLDPSSTPQIRQSARKPFAYLRKETESSLKSIHPSSDSSRDQDGHKDRLSSPVRQTAAATQTRSRQRLSTMGPPAAKPSAVSQPRTTSKADAETNYDSDETSSPISSPGLPPLKRKHDPIPGFDNDTQSNFTQDGHITAAYIHRQRETGAWPDWFVPQPVQLSEGKRPKRHGTRKST